MKVEPTDLDGVLVISLRVFGDSRGYFYESFQRERYREAGIPGPFVQDNVSRSSRGVLRGFHFQYPKAQGKLVSVLEGEVYDVAVDIRRGSPRFGDWTSVTLSSDNHLQLWIPPGFAHGFQVVSEYAVIQYKCTDYFSSDTERSLLWSDPALAIRWPVDDKIVSDKDKSGVRLADMSAEMLPP